MAGKLQISTELSGPWQNDNYCPPPPLNVCWSAILSAQLNGIFISIPKRHLFSNGARVAVVMVLPANLIISIERTQSGGGVKGRWEGARGGGAEVRARCLEPQRLSFYQGGTGETPGHKQQHQLMSDRALCLLTLIVSQTYGPCRTNANPPNVVTFRGFYEETTKFSKKEST